MSNTEAGLIKQYLADGVYVTYDPARGFILTTENGERVTNTIVLEPRTYIYFVGFVRRMKEGRW